MTGSFSSIRSVYILLNSTANQTNIEETNCVLTVSGGSEACGGGSGKPELHDPPLIFDLAKDEAEGSPLDPASEEYQKVLKQVEKEREALLWDIATDNVSTADYAISHAAVPCCQPQNPACRCHRSQLRPESDCFHVQNQMCIPLQKNTDLQDSEFTGEG